jgi:hypothetical protein
MIPSNEIRYLAVVGDVHGALDELFDVLLHRLSGFGHIVGVLQAGDLGVFGPGSVLDKATRRFAASDPTELGLAAYITGGREPPLPMWFTRGNHEDFDLLARSGDAIDLLGHIRHLPDGVVSEVAGLRVLAIGGIPGDNAERRSGKYFRPDDVQEAAILALDAGPVDILLTHAGPKGCSVEGNPLAGSWELLELIDIVRPRWHFFGHHGHPPRPGVCGRTVVVPLNQPDVLRVPRRDGGIGLLTLDGESQFQFVRDGQLVAWDELDAS